MALDRRPEAAVWLLISLCAAILFSSCGVLPISPVEATRGVLRARVGETGTDGPVYCRDVRLCGSDVLPAFYRARDFRPAWIDDGLTLTGATSFLAALSLVSEDGLDPKTTTWTPSNPCSVRLRRPWGKGPEKPGPRPSSIWRCS